MRKMKGKGIILFLYGLILLESKTREYQGRGKTIKKGAHLTSERLKMNVNGVIWLCV